MPVSFYLMVEDASPRRRYDGAARRAGAAATRARIIESASTAFLAHGFVGATVPRIASEAGVAVETVYRAAAGKAGLLDLAVQAALAGGAVAALTPVDDRTGIRRVIDEPDPKKKIAAYVATAVGTWRRAGPLLRVLDGAAASEPLLEELRSSLAERRLRGMSRFATSLADDGALLHGVTLERAADILWTMCAQGNYDSLVGARGWSEGEYRRWLTDVLIRALLEV